MEDTRNPDDQDQLLKRFLDSVLGANQSFTEPTVVSLIELLKEKERLKQDQVRLQIIDKSLQLVQFAIQHQINPDYVPFLFVSNLDNHDLIQELRRLQEAQTGQGPGLESRSVVNAQVSQVQKPQMTLSPAQTAPPPPPAPQSSHHVSQPHIQPHSPRLSARPSPRQEHSIKRRSMDDRLHRRTQSELQPPPFIQNQRSPVYYKPSQIMYFPHEVQQRPPFLYQQFQQFPPPQLIQQPQQHQLTPIPPQQQQFSSPMTPQRAARDDPRRLKNDYSFMISTPSNPPR